MRSCFYFQSSKSKLLQIPNVYEERLQTLNIAGNRTFEKKERILERKILRQSLFCIIKICTVKLEEQRYIQSNKIH